MPGHKPRPSSPNSAAIAGVCVLRWLEWWVWVARRRDSGRASIWASAWPLWAVNAPVLPSSSSMRRVSGRRLAVLRGIPPPGVYQLRTEGYHNESVNVL
jgi:hypothetical protein